MKTREQQKERNEQVAKWVIDPIITTFTVHYCVNTWLMFAHKPEVFPWYIGFIFGFNIKAVRISILAWLLTLIATYFV